jgi:hypothetical protein
VSFNDAMMLLVFIAMGAWIYGMIWFFGADSGNRKRWCLHSWHRECDLCRWCRTREGEPPRAN